MTHYFQTTAGSLRQALNLCGRVVHYRNTIPSLSCVCIADGKMRATDLDVAISVDLPGAGDGFAALINYRQLAASLYGLPFDAAVKLERADDGVLLRFAGARYVLSSLDADDYMHVDFKGKVIDRISEDAAFVDAVKTVFFSVSTEETRYYLNGVNFQTLETRGASAIATDGHRLTLKTLPKTKLNGSYIVGRDTCKLIQAVGVEPKKVEFVENRVRINWPGVTITSKLIDGTFPPVERVIPKADMLENTICLPIRETKQALNRIARIGSARGQRSTAVTFLLSKAGLMAAIDYSDAKAFEKIAGFNPETLTSDDFTCGYQVKYLKDCFALAKAHGHSSLKMFQADEVSPAVSNIRDDILTVLMPARAATDLSEDIFNQDFSEPAVEIKEEVPA